GATLPPAAAAGLAPEGSVGRERARGGPTSHTAIIARQLGIPCVVAVAGLDDVPAGTLVMIDGTQGRITVSPDEAAAWDEVNKARRGAELLAGWAGPGVTSDGYAVAVLVNVQDG